MFVWAHLSLVLGMKKYLFSLLCLGLFACQNQIHTADQLISAHIEKLGGYEALKSIHTLTFIGSYEEASFQQVHRFDRKRPNLIRVTTNYNEETGSYGYCEGFDGAAWEYRSKIPVRVIGMPSKALKNASRFEKSYIDYTQKGYQAQLLGTVNIYDNQLYHLRITLDNDKTEDFYFDINSLMETVSLGNVPFHGEGAVIEIFEKRSDYRPVGGILMPFTIQQKSGEEVLSTIAWDKIEANHELPEDWFSPPLSLEQEMFTAIRTTALKDGLSKLAQQFQEYQQLAEQQLNKKLENELNTFGYELISYERYEDAIQVFQLALSHYPESGNLYDSLGEAYLLKGDTVKGISHYQTALRLNPDNAHAKRVLKEISPGE